MAPDADTDLAKCGQRPVRRRHPSRRAPSGVRSRLRERLVSRLVGPQSDHRRPEGVASAMPLAAEKLRRIERLLARRPHAFARKGPRYRHATTRSAPGGANDERQVRRRGRHPTRAARGLGTPGVVQPAPLRRSEARAGLPSSARASPDVPGHGFRARIARSRSPAGLDQSRRPSSFRMMRHRVASAGSWGRRNDHPAYEPAPPRRSTSRERGETACRSANVSRGGWSPPLLRRSGRYRRPRPSGSRSRRSSGLPRESRTGSATGRDVAEGAIRGC